MADKTGTGIRPSFLSDDRLSLQAKGLLAIITNYSYEQIIHLERTNAGFAQSLNELRSKGYIRAFDADVFEVRLTLPPEVGEYV